MKQRYRLEAQDQSVNLYDVELTTRSAAFKEIPMMVRKSDIGTLQKGDQVLVGYLGPNKYPFIWDAMIWDMPSARKSHRIPYNIAEGEKFFSTDKANSFHMRKDGALVFRGSRITNDTFGYSDCYLILGGNQGTNIITDKKIRVSVGLDQLGNVLTIDEEGNVFIDASSTLNISSFKMRQWVDSVLKLFVGREVEDNDKREGEADIHVGKRVTTTIGETHELNVGDATKDPSDNRYHATSTTNIAKKFTMNVGKNATITVEMVASEKSNIKVVTDKCTIEVDDDTEQITIDIGGEGKIYITPEGVRLGDLNARDWLVLGIKLVQWLAMHTHTSTSPGQPTSPALQGGQLDNILSKDHKIKK